MNLWPSLPSLPHKPHLSHANRPLLSPAVSSDDVRHSPLPSLPKPIKHAGVKALPCFEEEATTVGAVKSSIVKHHAPCSQDLCQERQAQLCGLLFERVKVEKWSTPESLGRSKFFCLFIVWEILSAIVLVCVIWGFLTQDTMHCLPISVKIRRLHRRAALEAFFWYPAVRFDLLRQYRSPVVTVNKSTSKKREEPGKQNLWGLMK